MTAPLDRSATTAEAAVDLLLPEGTCLLHIGPPKTGTTSLQAAFWGARRDALAQGVRYAGRSRHESQAALAVARSTTGAPDRPTIRQWHALADEVRRAKEPRVVLSSEALSYADSGAVHRVIGDLAPREPRVIVTLRPLPKILPSAWQQFVKHGLDASYEAWLDAILNRPPAKITPLFWRQQRHDELVARWSGVVDPARVTVVVVDDRDHDGLLRTFEAFTGLRSGTLAPVKDLANRSLTAIEVEAVRALTQRLRAEGFASAEIDRMVRGRSAAYLLTRRPDPAEPRIETPQWALDRAGEIAGEMIAAIGSSGVRVIGDLATLTVGPDPGSPFEGSDEIAQTREVAAWLAYGMYLAGRHDAEARGAGRRLVSGAMLRLPPSVAVRLRALRPR